MGIKVNWEGIGEFAFPDDWTEEQVLAEIKSPRFRNQLIAAGHDVPPSPEQSEISKGYDLFKNQLGQMATSLGAAVADKVGADKLSTNMLELWKEYSRKANLYQGALKNPTAASIEDLSGFLNWASAALGNQAPQMGAQIALGGLATLVGGPLAGAAAFGALGAAQTMGEISSEIQETQPDKPLTAGQMGAAAGGALAALPVEAIPAAIGLKAITKPLSKGASRAVASLTGAGVGAGAGLVTEGIQEGAIEPTAVAAGTGQPLDPKSMLAQGAEGAALGTLLGGMGGGAIGAMRPRAKEAPKPFEPTPEDKVPPGSEAANDNLFAQDNEQLSATEQELISLGATPLEATTASQRLSPMDLVLFKNSLRQKRAVERNLITPIEPVLGDPDVQTGPLVANEFIREVPQDTSIIPPLPQVLGGLTPMGTDPRVSSVPVDISIPREVIPQAEATKITEALPQFDPGTGFPVVGPTSPVRTGPSEAIPPSSPLVPPTLVEPTGITGPGQRTAPTTFSHKTLYQQAVDRVLATGKAHPLSYQFALKLTTKQAHEIHNQMQAEGLIKKVGKDWVLGRKTLDPLSTDITPAPPKTTPFEARPTENIQAEQAAATPSSAKRIPIKFKKKVDPQVASASTVGGLTPDAALQEEDVTETIEAANPQNLPKEAIPFKIGPSFARRQPKVEAVQVQATEPPVTPVVPDLADNKPEGALPLGAAQVPGGRVFIEFPDTHHRNLYYMSDEPSVSEADMVAAGIGARHQIAHIKEIQKAYRDSIMSQARKLPPGSTYRAKGVAETPNVVRGDYSKVTAFAPKSLAKAGFKIEGVSGSFPNEHHRTLYMSPTYNKEAGRALGIRKPDWKARHEQYRDDVNVIARRSGGDFIAPYFDNPFKASVQVGDDGSPVLLGAAKNLIFTQLEPHLRDSPKVRQAIDEAIEAIRHIAGDDVIVKIVDEAAVGKQRIGGAYASISQVIYYSIDGHQLGKLDTAFHEAYHFLEAIYAIPDSMIRALNKHLPALKAYAKKHMPGNEHFLDNQTPEEIRAYAAGVYLHKLARGRFDELNITPEVKSFWNTLLNIFNSVAKALGMHSFRRPEDLFTDVFLQKFSSKPLFSKVLDLHASMYNVLYHGRPANEHSLRKWLGPTSHGQFIDSEGQPHIFMTNADASGYAVVSNGEGVELFDATYESGTPVFFSYAVTRAKSPWVLRGNLPSEDTTLSEAMFDYKMSNKRGDDPEISGTRSKKEYMEVLKKRGYDSVLLKMDDGRQIAWIFDDKDVRTPAQSIVERDVRTVKPSLLRLTKPEDKSYTDMPQVNSVNDIGWWARTIASPLHLAATNPQYARYFHVAHKGIVNEKDLMMSNAAKIIESYSTVNEDEQARIHAAMELARLMNVRLKTTPSGEIVVTNNGVEDEGALATLSRPGAVIRLSQKEAKVYLDLQEMFRYLNKEMRDAMLAFNGQLPGTTLADLKQIIEVTKDPAKKMQLEQLAQFLAESHSHDSRDYVPFTRFGRRAVAIYRIYTNEDGRKIKKLLEMRTIENAETNMGKRLKAGAVQKIRREYIDKYIREQGIPANEIKLEEFDLTYNNLLRDIGGDAYTALDMITSQMSGLSKGLEKSKQDKQSALDLMRAALMKRGFGAHLQKAQKLPGYDTDFRRSIGHYIAGATHFIAHTKYNQQVNDAIKDMDGMGNLQKRATDHYEYLQNPTDEFMRLRQYGYFMALGLNPASAALQVSTVPMVAYPILAMIGGHKSAAAILTKTLGISMKGALLDAYTAAKFQKTKDPKLYFDPAHLKLDKDELAAVEWAYDTGITKALVSLDLAGIDVVRRSNLPKAVESKWAQIQLAAGSLFNTMEAVSRNSVFLAAYRMLGSPEARAKYEQNISMRDASAREALRGLEGDEWRRQAAAQLVDSIFSVYGKIGRPPYMYKFFGGFGTALFQFQSYMQNQIELLGRLAVNHGSAGRTAAALMLVSLMMVAGWQGLPFARALKDLLEKFMPGLNVEKEVLQYFNKEWGSPLAGEVVNQGLGRLMGLNLGQRISLGDLPVTNAAIDAIDMAIGAGNGPSQAFGMGANLLLANSVHSYKALQREEYAKAFIEQMPTSIKNVAYGMYFWPNEGVVSKTQRRRYMTPEEISPLSQAAKIAGFESTEVARAREFGYWERRAEHAMDSKETGYRDRLKISFEEYIQATRDRNPEAARAALLKRQSILKEIREFNAGKPPHERITIDVAAASKAAQDNMRPGQTMRGVNKQARQEVRDIRKLRESF